MVEKNKIGNWSKWEPIGGLANKYHLLDIVLNSNGLSIRLINNEEKSKVTIDFKESVWSYRMIDEGFMLLTENHLYSKYGSDFYLNWSFFKVSESDFLNWIATQSFNISTKLHLKQFSILNFDDCIDIVAGYEPEVSLSKI